jgi:membrane protein involved in colicin uptake
MTTIQALIPRPGRRDLRRCRPVRRQRRRGRHQGRQGDLRAGQGLRQGRLRHRQEGLRLPGGNAKDICVAEAKAKSTRVDENAEAAYKNTPKAREHATHEIAEADYKVAKERCDDKAGNDKDVCVKEAKAAMTKVQADAKAAQKGTEARMDANQDKRDADYKVAAEKCDTMSGDAKSSCIANAKAHYGK